MKINLPQEVIEIIEKLNQNSFEAYVVGGALRDTILNKSPSDYDIATSANYEQIQEVFKEYDIIPYGLKHGTIILRVNNHNFEITTFRGNSLKEDLSLRDFTINSLAYSINEGLIDYVGAYQDIENKIIKINGNDDTVLKNDPLRILRAIRFASTLSFKIEENTKNYLLKNYYLLDNVAKERIREEFIKILCSNDGVKYLDEYFDIFAYLIKELRPLKGFNQNNPYHYLDVWEHTLCVIKNVECDEELKLAALFHDIGKPCVYSEKNGIGHFYNHPTFSKQIAERNLTNLIFDNKTINNVLILIEYHDYYFNSKKHIKKLLNLIDNDLFEKLIKLKKADVIAQSPKYIDRLKTLDEILNEYKNIINNKECFLLKDLKINGNDLITLGFNGKDIGEILDKVLKKVINEELENDKTVLIKYVSKLNK